MTKRGEATTQFNRNKNIISQKLEEVLIIKTAYKELVDEGIITFQYEQFRVLCNKFLLNKEVNNKPKIKNNPQVSSNQISSRASQNVKHPTFKHNPSMTQERLNELIGD